ncbi:hypothetical protein HKX48_000172 [Thoreauomyces humboldtii]|nr:hypothetical protein HKX48_000172 [Thoreauomyces humboldtii]
MRTSQLTLAASTFASTSGVGTIRLALALAKHTKKRAAALYDLPTEIWSKIFSFLDPSASAQAVHRFSLVCRRWNVISRDPHARAALFAYHYGRPLALYHAFRTHRVALTVPVATLLRKKGSALPRFLVQYVDKEYHRTDRGRKSVSVPLYVFFVQQGYQLYGNEAGFKDDDVAKFERLLYAAPTTAQIPDANAAEQTLAALHTLLDDYRFVPVRGIGSPVDETVFLLSKLDVSLIPTLVNNGLDLSSVNDQVLERVLWRADITDSHLDRYLAHGFKLTPVAIQKALQAARQTTLDVLAKHVPPELLAVCANNAVIDMFGPSVGRGWHWTAESVDFVIKTFKVTDETIRTALFTHPDSLRLANGGRAEFPATRCYMKTNPCPVWRWVLQTYGPHHELTRACFDDALSRAAADRDLHVLHDEFLAAGVRFYPRHVKILACRLLHRDMTANALHLLQALREQVSDERDSGVLVETERDDWLVAIREEIIDNEEWNHRMRTTQLEGGARGGAYRISRPPDDALRFLDESRALLEDLAPPIPQVATVVLRKSSSSRSSSERRTVMHRSASMRSWVKRMGTWWKEQCEKGVWGSVDNVI